MTRADALAVWQDLTRELWPEADVEKSALRIEHQKHVDWLLDEQYACGCPDLYTFAQNPRHLHDCAMMAAFEALDMPEGHAEVGRAFDEARPTALGQSYDLYRGPIGTFQQLRAEGIEQALMRGPFPTSASMEARVAAIQRLVEEGILTQEQADDMAMGR